MTYLPCTIELVNLSKSNVISTKSIESKLSSARLLADIDSGESMLRQGHCLELIQALGPRCLCLRTDSLDQQSQIKALTLLLV